MNRLLALALFSLFSFFLFPLASPAAATVPAVAIAQEPLYSGRANVHPNLLLSLSVEFPTVGIAYRGDGGTYKRALEYVGYFNPVRCYVYEGGNRNLGDSAYFRVHGDADPETHECDGASFSGNFMNWAASSAIDMLRYALTGGDRIIDEPGLTVLQRAVLPTSFYADPTYFPRRIVKAGDGTSAPGKVTPFQVHTLYVVSCSNRILFSDVNSNVAGSSEYCAAAYDGKGAPAEAARDKKLGEFLARVRVCDVQEGPARPDLCLKYGEHYKPVGELQRNAARVRVGAMGYLLDDDAARYGGVLRAPLKYLGASRIDAPAFVAAANDRPEWDSKTGVFHANPEHAPAKNGASASSGVINYLNRFGRNGQYKAHDPVGELYYEGLRYLQGKQPTTAATKGMTIVMQDGFPVLERWNDPVIASCQRHFILSIADVNTHWDRYIPGNERTTYGANSDAFDPRRSADAAVAGKTPELDVMHWTRKVGQLESDGAHGNPKPNAALKNLESMDTGAGGHGTYYMAGLAYWAHTSDIRIDKPVRVTTFAVDVDEGGNGRIDGNKRSIPPRSSQLYLAAKYGGFNDRNGDGNPFITVDAGGKTVLNGTDIEWDNGDGVPQNYFLAGQPREMIAAIRRVFSQIVAGSGTVSGVGLSTGKAWIGDAHVYQPGFDPARWSGSLRKLALGIDDDLSVNIASAASWDAGELLTGGKGSAPQPAPGKRNIHTAISEKGRIETIRFRWDELSPVQRQALGASPVDGSDDGLGAERLDYLRGMRTREIGQADGIFRRRDRVLGDIVNSNPLYVGPPLARALDAEYPVFLEKNRARAPVVYVGANDGMLHAFDARDGIELFAYVPSVLIPELSLLTRPDYTHRPFVDGGLSAGDALVQGKWKTLLAGAFGGGAQGLFALDITDPAHFDAGLGALFEFTDTDDPDIGNITGAPAIAKFRTGTEKGLPQYKYFVVAASGLNNYADDGEERYNSDAAGALFLISVDKPASEKWKEGKNYYKFRLPASLPNAVNGLAQPALVAGADGAIRHAYAGDLQGNLWRLDFRADAPWSTATGDARPIFLTRDAKGKRQPITGAPQVVFAPGGGYLVLFGTGKFIEHADAAPGNFSVQTFYAVHDTLRGTASLSRVHLAPRTVQEVDGGGYTLAGDAIDYGSVGQRGWYLDFPESDETGERVVTNAVVLNGSVYFNSLIPGSDPCAPGGGRSYALTTLTGLAQGTVTGVPSQVGMLSAPVVLESGIEVGKRNAVGARIVKRRHGVVNFGTGGSKGMADPPEEGNGVTSLRAGRFSWREIINWQELRDAWSKK